MTDSDRWLLIVGLAAITFALKAAGPVALGGRPLPAPALRVIALLAAPLMCALVVTALFSDGPRWSVGAHTIGVAVAGLLMWRWRLPLLWAALVATALTALLRAIT
ncbi:putative membrane protein [Kineosphaera limosa]|uniref:Uncharacterized protein n=1 Tax=Kineosphaera limosa NBRC 100340 TaxID=1184609 RepID=K6W5W0_9MICO|nr:AzlD domain-containing protein [Kineosphaera limosa]NYD99453.1 putative membrane protein [Kineosphaera limosa]GAB94565.1 hypothetical protein KILIM_007_00030 [Kineosphaera limosa NBRC 100340]